MIIIMRTEATPEQVQEIENEITRIGLRPFINPGVERKVIAVLGALDARKGDLVEHFSVFPGVARVDVDFFSGPKPTGTFHAPSEALRADKHQFGASRRARWFGR